MMYWFTGYIFDTCNELIQMFYARKDLPSIIAAVLSIRLPLERPRRPAVGEPLVPGRGAGPPARSPHARPPSFLGQNALDGCSVTAICVGRWRLSFTRCSH